MDDICAAHKAHQWRSVLDDTSYKLGYKAMKTVEIFKFMGL
jgi:hypothetical protein